MKLLIRLQVIFSVLKAAKAIRPLHIQHDLLIHDQFVVQAEIVAIRIEQVVVKRLDDDVVAQFPFDFIAG